VLEKMQLTCSDAVIHPPAAMVAAWPTTVTTSRWPRALARSTQKPILDIMVRDALDETGENFLRLILGWVFHI
jgi:hypothetical protein